jgi:hypothetical protein
MCLARKKPKRANPDPSEASAVAPRGLQGSSGPMGLATAESSNAPPPSARAGLDTCFYDSVNIRA